MVHFVYQLLLSIVFKDTFLHLGLTPSQNEEKIEKGFKLFILDNIPGTKPSKKVKFSPAKLDKNGILMSGPASFSYKGSINE